MKFVKNLLIFVMLASGQIAQAQLFKLEAGIGATQISWHENEKTVDLNVQLSIQKKQSKSKFFVALKAYGNIERSQVDRSKYTFIEPRNTNSTIIHPNDALFSNYRGSEAEIGVMWNQKESKKPVFYPILSIYSKSVARKISTVKSQYMEEEKYRLHGINTGIGLKIPGPVAFNFQGQVFKPILSDISLYGNYFGVPSSSIGSNNSLSYIGKLGFRKAKIGALIAYEVLNLGSTKNKNTKSIPVSQLNSLSISFQYEF